MYEVQLHKKLFPQSDYFTTEYIFEQKGEPTSLVVKVRRPPLYLDDFLKIWTDRGRTKALSEQMQEAYHPLKLYYIIVQLLNLIKTKLFDKKIENQCLTLRCFNICKISLEIKMTNFAFA